MAIIFLPFKYQRHIILTTYCITFTYLEVKFQKPLKKYLDMIFEKMEINNREVWVKTALRGQWVVKFEKYQFSLRIFFSTPSMTLIQRAF